MAELEARLEAGMRDACRMAVGACEARLAPLESQLVCLGAMEQQLARLAPLEQQLENSCLAVQALEERVAQLAESSRRTEEQVAGSPEGQLNSQECQNVLRAVVSDIDVLRASCNRNACSVEELRNAKALQQAPGGLQELEEALRGELDVLREQQLRVRGEIATLRAPAAGAGGYPSLSQEAWGQLANTARAAVQSELTAEIRSLQHRLSSDILALQEQQAHFAGGLDELRRQQAAGGEAMRLLEELSLRHGSELEAMKASLASGAEELRGHHGGGTGELGHDAVAADGAGGWTEATQGTRSADTSRGGGGAPPAGPQTGRAAQAELEALKHQVCEELEELRTQQLQLAGALQDLRSQLGSNTEALKVLSGQFVSNERGAEAARHEAAAAADTEALRKWVSEELRSLRGQQGKSEEELEAVRAHVAGELEAVRARASRSTGEVQELWKAHSVMTEALRGQLARELEALTLREGMLEEHCAAAHGALREQQGQSSQSLDTMQQLHGSAIEALRKQQAGLAEVIKNQLKSELEAITRPKAPEDEGS